MQEEPRLVRIDTAPTPAPQHAAAPGRDGPQHAGSYSAEQPIADRHPLASTVTKSSRSRFEPDALIAAAVGLAWAMLGLIVIVRCGVSGPMATPVADTLGFSHTATLGMIELAIGLALMFSGISRSRSAELTFALVLGVAGFLGAVQHDSFTTSLALEPQLGWLAVLTGGGVALAALLMPRFARRTNTVEQHWSTSPGEDGIQ